MTGTIAATVAVCPVCDSKHTRFISTYRGHHDAFVQCSILGCNDCDMVFVHPMPDEQFLYEYNHSYFSNAHGGISADPLTVAFHSAINLLRVLHVEKFLTKTGIQAKRILEIGPGPGNFAKNWLQKNPDTLSYTVVESDDVCYDSLSALGLQVYKEVADIPYTELFDLVVISHVLEHTSQPEAFIKQCTQLLVAGGILFIEVPCNDYEHKEIVEPHLLFFDKVPLQRLLTNAGFADIRLSYHGNTITDLKKGISFSRRIVNKFRNALLRAGILFPFSFMAPGLEGVNDPLERACAKPFKAHLEQSEPSWWLRAVAIKN